VRVRAQAGVACDAGAIAQVFATHLRGMPSRAIRSDPHNVSTIPGRDVLLWCAYSERVAAGDGETITCLNDDEWRQVPS